MEFLRCIRLVSSIKNEPKSYANHALFAECFSGPMGDNSGNPENNSQENLNGHRAFDGFRLDADHHREQLTGSDRPTADIATDEVVARQRSSTDIWIQAADLRFTEVQSA